MKERKFIDYNDFITNGFMELNEFHNQSNFKFFNFVKDEHVYSGYYLLQKSNGKLIIKLLRDKRTKHKIVARAMVVSND